VKRRGKEGEQKRGGERRRWISAKGQGRRRELKENEGEERGGVRVREKTNKRRGGEKEKKGKSVPD